MRQNKKEAGAKFNVGIILRVNAKFSTTKSGASSGCGRLAHRIDPVMSLVDQRAVGCMVVDR